MGPVEWGTVVAHWPYGLDVFLDSSGEVGTVDRLQVCDGAIRSNEEYWPDVGDRIRVRRMEVRPDGELRLTARQSDVEWSEPWELVRMRMTGWPSGLRLAEWGVITALRERGFDVLLLASGETGTVMQSLIEADRKVFKTDFHPVVGQPIRVCRLGVWPDGTLRLSHRACFLRIQDPPDRIDYDPPPGPVPPAPPPGRAIGTDIPLDDPRLLPHWARKRQQEEQQNQT
mgnify:FL=1